jgi:hypothetical protein
MKCFYKPKLIFLLFAMQNYKELQKIRSEISLAKRLVDSGGAFLPNPNLKHGRVDFSY